MIDTDTSPVDGTNSPHPLKWARLSNLFLKNRVRKEKNNNFTPEKLPDITLNKQWRLKTSVTSCGYLVLLEMVWFSKDISLCYILLKTCSLILIIRKKKKNQTDPNWGYSAKYLILLRSLKVMKNKKWPRNFHRPVGDMVRNAKWYSGWSLGTEKGHKWKN